MSRRCELTGKALQVGHQVSHSNIKTKKVYRPNLRPITFLSDALGRSFRFRVAAAAIRTVDHCGGLDAYLAKADPGLLSPAALRVKKDLEKVRAAA